MGRIWQWAWDRYAEHYLWAFCIIGFPLLLQILLVPSFAVVALEDSASYLEAAVAAAITVAALLFVTALPARSEFRIVDQWAVGRDVDRAEALRATYIWGRASGKRAVLANAIGVAALLAGIAAITSASGGRIAQYAIFGALLGAGVQLISLHSFVEGAIRPVRLAIAGDSGIGDSMPRSRPSFASWSNLSILATAFAFAAAGAMVTAVFDVDAPVVLVAISLALTLFFAVPMTVGAAFSPSLQPIRDLAAATERVTAGDYGRRVPVVQDDDLGVLAASFNRMQAGLAERQRLASAFGTYVDPVLAARLLEQGDDVFTGERREVTVMFVDIRDFTPFAEANSAEDTVSRLNTLFEIVVPAVVDAGGHVNKFLGDGALAVFGAPNDLADHADAAVHSAVVIHRRVAERFEGALRIGIGINTGPVIAGTIGGGGKLEFTLIGDTVNVAARVEQLTKETGDVVLLTQQTVDALSSAPPGLVDRGPRQLKGKSAAVAVYGLQEAPR